MKVLRAGPAPLTLGALGRWTKSWRPLGARARHTVVCEKYLKHGTRLRVNHDLIPDNELKRKSRVEPPLVVTH
jgi:hypothetical protein